MTEPLAPELEARAQELAARIVARSAADILDMARRLVATTDDTLFGDTEFALRDQARGLVDYAYAEHLPQKVATPPLPSTAPFHSYRAKVVETLGGSITCRRAHKRCVCRCVHLADLVSEQDLQPDTRSNRLQAVEGSLYSPGELGLYNQL